MTTIETFTILFYIRKERSNKDNEAPIYCRVTVNGKRAEISLKKYVVPVKWDSNANKAKGSTAEAKKINEHLRIVKNKLHDYQELLFEKNEIITAQKIKDLYLGKEIGRKTVMEVFEYHNKQLKSLEGISFATATIKKYNTSKNHIENFIEYKYKAKDLFLKELNYSFINEFEIYLRTTCNCNNNSAVKYIKNFRKIINLALKNEWLDKDPFAKYKAIIKPVKREFLTVEELKNLKDKNLKIERLELVRDLFVFSCYTGLAYIDVATLTKDKINKTEDGKLFLNTDRTKTKNPSYIPLLVEAVQIIEKYSDHIKVETSNIVLPSLSNQKLNSYLKEIADLVGIEKNLTFHIARHTFATHRLTEGFSTEVVGSMLGHKDIRTTQHYSKVVEEKIWNEFDNLKK